MAKLTIPFLKKCFQWLFSVYKKIQIRLNVLMVFYHTLIYVVNLFFDILNARYCVRISLKINAIYIGRYIPISFFF